MSPRKCARSWRERGATAVEFALILPLFALFVFGTVEFGMAFTNMNSLRNGAREGARSGIVASFGSDLSCPVSGTAPNDTTKALVCRTKARTELALDRVRVKIDWTNQYRPGDPFVICAQYAIGSVTGMFEPIIGHRIIKTRVEMRIETINTNLQKFAETPPTGGSWSWC